jgi:hypothetical protein
MWEKFNFTERQIEQYFNSAFRDFRIAESSKVPEVTFRFGYDALLKLAIAICAKNSLRIKSRTGHHVELINKLAEFLPNSDIEIIGQKMRQKRNWDLYDGGITISEKEAEEFFEWIKKIFAQGKNYLDKKPKLL